jgi:hypothetical protein
MVETAAIIRSMSVGSLACVAWIFAIRNAAQIYRISKGTKVLAQVNSTVGTGDPESPKMAYFTYATPDALKKEHVGIISKAIGFVITLRSRQKWQQKMTTGGGVAPKS